MKYKNGYYLTKQGFLYDTSGIYVKKISDNHFMIYLDTHPPLHCPRVTFELRDGVFEYRSFQGLGKSLVCNSLFYTVPVGVLSYFTSPFSFDIQSALFLFCFMLFFMCLTIATIPLTKIGVRSKLSIAKLESMNLI